MANRATTARASASASDAAGAGKQTSALKRGLVVLELVAESGKRGVSVTEIATRLDLDKSTGSRILATLREAGYVQQNVDHRYYSTARLGKLAHRRPGAVDVAALARERLEDLHRQYDEAIHLAVVNGGEMLFLDYLQTTKAVRTAIPMVPRPLHQVAVGIAVLAAVRHDERSQLMLESMAAAHERLSKRQRLELAEEVSLARDRGWASIENHDDVSRVAVALVDAAGRPIGAICLSGPSYRIEPNLAVIAADTIAAARDIAALLPE